MSGEAKPGLLVVLGLACLAGAVALAWFSAVQTLQLTRTDGGVSVSLQARLFGLVLVSETQLEEVRSARAVTTVPETSRSRPYTYLFFDTPSGAVDLFTPNQAFRPSYSDIEAFFADPAQPTATFSSLIDGGETTRFVVAQLVVLFLALCGVGFIYVAVGSIFGRDRSIGPIDAGR